MTDTDRRLRVAEAALTEIERQLRLIPASAISEMNEWEQIINMDAAIGAWRRGLILPVRASVGYQGEQ